MSTSDVAKLREETGAGMMDCKKALDACGGDYAKAIEHLNKQGLAKAAKKSDRATGAGHLETYIHGGRVGVLLELRAETDFVTRSDAFKEFARNIAMHIAASAPESVEALLAKPYIRDESMTISDVVKGIIAKVGENVRVERFARYQI